MRQVALDTETTGLDTEEDRIIEIGCVELIDRHIGAEFHCIVNPERAIGAEARKVHGWGQQELADKPLFHEVADDLLRFVDQAEVIIHNASFDIGFLNREFEQAGRESDFAAHCRSVIDTLEMAREMFPGRRHSLDAMCDLYQIDRSERELHSALLDARLLAQMYLRMTSGQTDMEFAGGRPRDVAAQTPAQSAPPAALKILRATPEETERHQQMLEKIRAKAAGGACLWRETAEQKSAAPDALSPAER